MQARKAAEQAGGLRFVACFFVSFLFRNSPHPEVRFEIAHVDCRALFDSILSFGRPVNAATIARGLHAMQLQELDVTLGHVLVFVC